MPSLAWADAVLLSEYRFDDAAWCTPVSALDTVGGRNGTLIGGVAWEDSPASGGKPINGAATRITGGGAIDITGLPFNLAGGAQNSVSFWMLWDGTNNVMPMGFGLHDLWLQSGSFGFNTFNNDIFGISSAGLAGGWHHVTAVFTNGNVAANKLWIDGVPQVMTQRQSVPNNANAVVSAHMRFSGVWGNAGYQFMGALDVVRVYSGLITQAQVDADRALTSPAVACPPPPPPPPPTLVTHYRLDDNWDTTHSAANSVSGGPVGTFLPTYATKVATPAVAPNKPNTCSGASFAAGNGSMRSTGVSLDLSGGGKNSVSFWMYWNGGNNQMPFGFAIHDLWLQGGSFGFNSGNNDIFGISSAGLAGGWHHVAAVFTNGNIAANKLWIDGVPQVLTQRQSSPNNANAHAANTFQLSSWTNDNNYRFVGRLDELKVYRGALTDDMVVNDYTAICSVSAPNHIRLEHDGTAISCSAETVTVKACADASCSSLYTGAVSGNVTAGGNSVPFSIAAGSGQTTVNIHLPSESALADPQTVRLGTSAVSPVPADAGSPYCNGNVNNSTACDMSVSKAGFLFDVPHLTSGTASGTVNVSAVRSSDSSTCVPLFQNVSRTVAFWGAYQNPASGTQPLQVNGSNIETTATPAYTSTYTLAFNNSGVATLTSVRYDDVGLMQLNARYVGSTANTPPDGGMIVLGSDTFVVKPHHFDLSGIQQTAAPNLANPAAANAAGAKFVKAGENFTVTVTAKNALGGTTANYGQETAAESAKLTSALVGGLGLTNNPAVAGTFGAFSNGAATGTAFTWGEVGIITLTPGVADADYLGAGDVSGTASGNVGRFYPDHFVFSTGDIANRDGLSCAPASTFTYMGEPMLLTLTLVAQNVSNGLTQNYAGGFAKLDGATVGKWTVLGSNDSIGLGAVDGTTALSGRLAINGTPTGSWTMGTGTLSAGVVLNRDVSPDGAFNNLTLGIAPQDADGVTLLPGVLDLDADLNASSERKQAATTKVRYGRARINNAHGSELLVLPVPLKVEYYDSVSPGFVTNPDDSCTGFVIGDVVLSNPTGNLTVGASTPTFVNNPVAAGLSSIKLSKPGSGKYGSVDVTLTVPAWLQYAWGSGSNPTARATFGVYKGNEEFIYLREAY